MERVFLSPNRYVQGKDILTKAGTYISKLGNNALLLADKFVWNMVGNDLTKTLEKNDIRVETVIFNGECSTCEIERVTDLSKKSKVKCNYRCWWWKDNGHSKGCSE